MEREQGVLGIVGLHTARMPIDKWDMHHQSHSVLAYCDGAAFMDRYELNITTLALAVGHNWQVRCDNEEHIYYGMGRCTGLSRPSPRSFSPRWETYRYDLVLHFEFLYGHYGPYHISEGIAMARNGNCMFFDLLPLAEGLAVAENPPQP